MIDFYNAATELCRARGWNPEEPVPDPRNTTMAHVTVLRRTIAEIELRDHAYKNQLLSMFART